jgi:RHS repeat-associated protein
LVGQLNTSFLSFYWTLLEVYVSLGDRLNSQGTLGTDKLFTGQRLDSTGLYYYNARYYDPEIGRFISSDTVVQSFANPQTLNRYSYCVNNPLKYTDPTGQRTWGIGININLNLVLFNFSVNVMRVWDDKGGKAVAVTWGTGGATPSASIALQGQITSADTIQDLKSWSGAVGGSIPVYGPVSVGFEQMGNNQSGYQGQNYLLGLGTPYPEVHAYVENTTLHWASNPATQPGSTQPELPAGNQPMSTAAPVPTNPLITTQTISTSTYYAPFNIGSSYPTGFNDPGILPQMDYTKFNDQCWDF